MNVRAFLAFDIPSPVRQALATLIRDLGRLAQGIVWTDAAQLHVTLRFFGEVESELLLGEVSQRIAAVARATPPFSLECAGIGVFPNWKYPRVIWAGFAGVADRAMQLREHVDDGLAECELPVDARAFRLHLTIGRAKALHGKGELVKRVESLGMIQFGEVPIDHLTLYKSELTKQGAVYTALKTFPFKGGSPS